MSNLHYSWRLASVTFHLVQGDLFDIPVEAIVNSEQTDFVLAFGGGSVSSQIRKRFGAEVQRQLDDQTKGALLEPGAVLKTTGGPYPAIYHAGFHHPTEWLDDASREDSETEHLEVVRRCVRRVLQDVRDAPFSSVAFPLIGSGIFGLDAKLVARNFFEDVFQFALEPRSTREMNVWLVLYDEFTFHSVLEVGVQAWLTHTTPTLQWEPFDLGIPYLDVFEELMNRECHPRWSSWMHVRYAELATWFLAFVLANSSGERPESLVRSRWPLSFGNVRFIAERMARQFLDSQNNDRWQHFLSALVADAVSAGVIKRLNDDRNAIAHGRETRQAQDLRADIHQFIQSQKWKELAQECQPPGQNGLPPWLVLQPGDVHMGNGRNIGVFESWKPGERTYVIPWSGGEFSIRAASA
jgi:O-acetyl-ADP-ribose deacetylase (regulator of RNase III)